MQTFAGYVKRRIDPAKTYRIAIGYAQNPDLARELGDTLREAMPSIESMHMVELGSAIGAHGGPGIMVVAAQEYVAPARDR